MDINAPRVNNVSVGLISSTPMFFGSFPVRVRVRVGIGRLVRLGLGLGIGFGFGLLVLDRVVSVLPLP
jgi:hypothetical protein